MYASWGVVSRMNSTSLADRFDTCTWKVHFRTSRCPASETHILLESDRLVLCLRIALDKSRHNPNYLDIRPFACLKYSHDDIRLSSRLTTCIQRGTVKSSSLSPGHFRLVLMVAAMERVGLVSKKPNLQSVLELTD